MRNRLYGSHRLHWVLLVLAFGLTACASVDDLNQTQAKVNQADARLKDIEAKVSTDKMVSIFDQLDRLNLELNRVKGELIDLNARVVAQEKNQQLMYDDLDARLPGAAKRTPMVTESLGTPTETAPATVAAKDSEGTVLYNQALSALRQKDFAQSKKTLTEFMASYPASTNRPEAVYWMGVSNEGLRDYNGAASSYQTFVAQYPNHSKAADALNNLGRMQVQLNRKDAARATFNQVITTYPQSPAATKARAQLSNL